MQCVSGGQTSREQGGEGGGGGGLVWNIRTTRWLLQPKIAANYDTNVPVQDCPFPENPGLHAQAKDPS